MNIDNRTKQRFESIKRESARYHDVWKDICTHFLPTCGSFNQKPSDKITLDYMKLLDADPNTYIVWLAAGMMSGMTNPSREWFSLGTDKGVWGETPEEAEYLKKRRSRIENTLHRSGVYLTLFKMYMELPTVGTYVFLVEKDPVNVMRTIAFTIGETYLGVGETGKIDTFGCTHWLTPREMVSAFGPRVPQHIRDRAEKDGASNERIAVYQLIEPNRNRKLDALDDKNKAFRSVYWTSGVNEYLRESGYDRFPVICPRWDLKHHNAVWGMGPGWVALGAVKSLQRVTADEYLAVEMGIKPPLLATAGAFKSEINLRPGAVLWQSQSVTDGLKPLFQAQMDLGKAELLVSKVKQTLKSQFFVDVMATMLSDPKTNQTATEVAEKVQERLAIMGPVLERLVEECHKPLIELADAYNAEQGLYDDLIPPESLQGEELKITFNSIFHEAQKASGTRSMDMLVGSFGQYAQIKPEILDLLDTDKLGRLVAEKLSLTEMMLDEDKVSAVRQERAQAQQTAAEMEQAQSAADISQKLAAADKQTAGLDFRGGY